MLFNSYIYILFLSTCVLLYWVAPRFRQFLLFLFGALFYIYYDVNYFYLIFILAAFTFFYGKLLAKYKNKYLLALGVSLIVLTLAYFKYANLIVYTLNNLGLNFSPLNILMPLGISFFTFEFIHYLVDIYYGKIIKTNLSVFFSFAFFFPSLISGPIKRFEQFSQQSDDIVFRPKYLYYGFLFLLAGYAQKYILADNLAPLIVNLKNPTLITSSASALKQLYFYSLRIYLDFSGMSHIAIGSALLFGILIPKNFNYPYLRSNISLFWRNWHMSLSSWVRDYLFIPLGGSKKRMVATIMNNLLVMIIVGIWHGASWNFALWGLWHGFGLGAYQMHKKYSSEWLQSKLVGRRYLANALTFLGVVITFNFVTIGWAFLQ